MANMRAPVYKDYGKSLTTLKYTIYSKNIINYRYYILCGGEELDG